jgi:SAM-dependent methyltransferase
MADHLLPSEPGKQPSLLSAEITDEMARLSLHDQLITKGMGGLFVEHDNQLPSTIKRVLDIGCGPGNWALSVARSYPTLTVTGLDISPTKLAFAQRRAQEEGQRNIAFVEANAREKLPFPDGAFDLVNGRFMAHFIQRDLWPSILGEIYRVTAPGGIVRLTEADSNGDTNSLAMQKLFDLAYQKFNHLGFGFSPNSSNLGITHVLKGLLCDVGYDPIYLRPHALNLSHGTALHAVQYHYYLSELKALEVLFLKTGATDAERFQTMANALLDEMRSEGFFSIWILLTAWGYKPASAPR